MTLAGFTRPSKKCMRASCVCGIDVLQWTYGHYHEYKDWAKENPKLGCCAVCCLSQCVMMQAGGIFGAVGMLLPLEEPIQIGASSIDSTFAWLLRKVLRVQSPQGAEADGVREDALWRQR